MLGAKLKIGEVMKYKNFTMAVMVLFFVIGCSASRPHELSRAESKLVVAKNDPFVLKNSPLELAEAERTIERAREEWRRTENKDEVVRISRQAIDQIDAAKLTAGKNATAVMAERANVSQQLLQKERQVTALQRQALDREVAQRVMMNELHTIRELELEKQMLVSLNSDVLFDVNQAILKRGAERELIPLASFLNSHPRHSITIEGHTDSTGDNRYNQTLSEQRARAVSNFLSQYGIASHRITSVGLGQEYPVASNATESGKLQNRRVEIFISPRGSMG